MYASITCTLRASSGSLILTHKVGENEQQYGIPIRDLATISERQLHEILKELAAWYMARLQLEQHILKTDLETSLGVVEVNKNAYPR